ncbi:MAG: Rpn family recombination-promoting nuclease/putative transposase [Planctomycetaceae bacterium]|jgi:predicted transposase/invertase (TIGR01784 family)|nr:Rpn family recombination-promoting nuclease/putative transposase [Planctomycetaceae bacterium]
MRYLDPKIDPIFKRIFGEHENLCCSLLNSMLPLKPSQQIVSIEYQPIDLLPDIPILKNSIVDVNCRDNTGRNFIVEMQMHWTDAFTVRVLFNAAKVYVKQLNKAGEYKLLKPVYALNFVNDIFVKDSSAFYHNFKMVNVADSTQIIEGLELVFIELPKFKPTNLHEKKLYDLWLTFLTGIESGSEHVPSELFNEKVTSEAVHYLETSSYTLNELNAYEYYCGLISTQRTLHNGFREEGMKEGIKKGMEKGKKEGRKEGRKEGIEEGKKEGIEEGEEKKLIEIVNNSHRKGYSIEQIQEITGLSSERILKIINPPLANDENQPH